MYSTLYVLTGVAFVVSVAVYTYFCIELSKDIKAGRIAVKAESEKN